VSATVYEHVQPDGRLVSSRAALPVFTLSTPDTPLPTSRGYYRTAASGMLFAFTFVRWRDGTYRAYICEQPSYGTRRVDAQTTHRNVDAAGRAYVCWQPPPENAPDVLRVARHWAERTDRYIRYGTALDR
jgi:hypothetical protein